MLFGRVEGLTGGNEAVFLEAGTGPEGGQVIEHLFIIKPKHAA